MPGPRPTIIGPVAEFATDLHYKGMSIAQIARELQPVLGHKISAETVRRFVRRLEDKQVARRRATSPQSEPQQGDRRLSTSPQAEPQLVKRISRDPLPEQRLNPGSGATPTVPFDLRYLHAYHQLAIGNGNGELHLTDEQRRDVAKAGLHLAIAAVQAFSDILTGPVEVV